MNEELRKIAVEAMGGVGVEDVARCATPRKPLRSEHVYEICRRTLPKTVAGLSFVPEWALPLARAAEAAHGITNKTN